MDIRNLIRTGQISAVNAANCSARVVFDDKDDIVSGELPIITRGSQTIKDYWLPDVGEQAVCLFLPNNKNLSDGFILGTYFSEVDTPSAGSTGKRKIDFGDGTTIDYDRESRALNLTCGGSVNIQAANGDVIVNGISLVNHTHPGCQGGSTGKAQ